MKSIFKNNAAVAVFVLPAVITVGLLVFYPLIQVFWYGFFRWDGLSAPEFIGLQNYGFMMEDPLFWRSFLNGWRIVVLVVAFQLGVGTLLAVSLSSHEKQFGRGFLRRSYFIPVVLSVTVVSQLWLSVYNAEFGLLNTLFERFGWEYRQEWLSDTGAAIWAIGFTNAWHYLGIHFIILYAGIRSIPEHYFEAALIDGANSWKRFWRITLPLLAETYRFSLIFAVTGGLRVFAESFIMTEGGPGTASYTLTFLVYRSAFRVNQYGYGNAVAVILVLEALLLTILIMRFVARERVTH